MLFVSQFIVAFSRRILRLQVLGLKLDAFVLLDMIVRSHGYGGLILISITAFS